MIQSTSEIQNMIQTVNPTRLAIEQRIKDYEASITDFQSRISDLKKVLPLFEDPISVQSYPYQFGQQG
jgi:hypothetical protein